MFLIRKCRLNQSLFYRIRVWSRLGARKTSLVSMMKALSTLFLLTSTTLAAGQRPVFTGYIPVGYPDSPNRASPDTLADRFGAGTTEPLPLEANGDKDLVNRLSKLPISKQPLWFIKWQAYEEQRKGTQNLKPNVDSMPNDGSYHFGTPESGIHRREFQTASDTDGSAIIQTVSVSPASAFSDSIPAGSKPEGLGRIAGSPINPQDADRSRGSTIETLPKEANGDREVLAHLSKLPANQQPFWFTNWNTYETSSWANSYAYSSSNNNNPGDPRGRPVTGILSTNSVQSSSGSSNAVIVNVNSGVPNMNRNVEYGSFVSSTGVPISNNRVVNTHSNTGQLFVRNSAPNVNSNANFNSGIERPIINTGASHFNTNSNSEIRLFVPNSGALDVNSNANLVSGIERPIINTGATNSNHNSNSGIGFVPNIGVPVTNNGNSNFNRQLNTENSVAVNQNMESLDRLPVHVQNSGIPYTNDAPNYNYNYRQMSSYSNNQASSSVSVRYR